LSTLSENRWNIWFGDNSLPRRMEVICRQKATDVLGQRKLLLAPRLVDLPIDRTLWTIGSPKSSGAASPEVGSVIEPTEHELLRLECIANLLKSAASLLNKEPEENVGAWYLPWAERLQFRRLTASQRNNAELSPELQTRNNERLTAIDHEEAELADRLGVQDVSNQPIAGAQLICEPTALLESTQPASNLRAHVMLTGNSPTIEVDFPNRSASQQMQRMFAALVVGLVGSTLLLASRRKHIRAADIPYLPEAVGATAGLIWWLWLTPAILGPAIVVCCAVAAWRNWQARESQPTRPIPRGSTVTRVISPANSSQLRNRPR
jgi:hypothetical protein